MRAGWTKVATLPGAAQIFVPPWNDIHPELPAVLVVTVVFVGGLGAGAYVLKRRARAGEGFSVKRRTAYASARPGALIGWIADLEASGILVDRLGTTDNGDRTVAVQMTLKAQGQ